MSVCTRKDGTIFVNWMEDGKRLRKYFGKGMQAMAEAVRYNDSVVNQGGGPRMSGPLFFELVNEYLRARAGSMASSTYVSMMYRLNRVILPQLGELPAIHIDHERLDQYVSWRTRTVRRTTAHRDLVCVRAVLRFAVKRGLIPHNPMEGYDMPEQDDAVILPLSEAEIQALITHAPEHLRRAILLSFFVGLRPGAVELLSITYNQVNWSENTITIISAKKRGVERREVYIHPALPLRKWFEADGSDQARHIITYQGLPIKACKSAWKTAKQRAGVGGRKIPMYALRKSFVTTLLHLGVDPETIASISGHNVTTMLKHYAHSANIRRKEAIAQLPSMHPVGAENEVGAGVEEGKKVNNYGQQST